MPDNMHSCYEKILQRTVADTKISISEIGSFVPEIRENLENITEQCKIQVTTILDEIPALPFLLLVGEDSLLRCWKFFFLQLF